jgi:hypothetical protein
MSKEQTFRSEDNAFCLCENGSCQCGGQRRYAMEAASQRQKDFETEHSGVFATPGLPFAHFLTGGIQVQ